MDETRFRGENQFCFVGYRENLNNREGQQDSTRVHKLYLDYNRRSLYQKFSMIEGLYGGTFYRNEEGEVSN